MSAATLPLELTSSFHDDQKQQVEIQPREVKDFLLHHQKSSYTTILTLRDGTALPLLDFHSDRLLSSFKALNPQTTPPTRAQLLDKILLILREALMHRQCVDSGDVQVVVALVHTASAVQLCVHASDVPDHVRSLAPIEVECRGEPRNQPEVKNTSWVQQRKPLENKRRKGVSETILLGTDDEGYRILLEGLVSNFYIVTRALEIWTAPTSLVLSGSIRSCVLFACQQLNITVREVGARLVDCENFDCAFLTNARRLLVPIRTIYLPSEEHGNKLPSKIDLPNGPVASSLIEKLRNLVYKRLEQEATSISETTTTLQPPI